MTKTKAVEDSLENHAMSIGMAVLRYYRTLVKARGFKPDHAMKVASGSGFDIFSVGVRSTYELTRAERTFRELSIIYDELADTCSSLVSQ
jgi:hypothetical protein